jgi:membrane protease YdiL (CAAX protease family)
MNDEMGGIDDKELMKMYFPKKSKIYYSNGLLLIAGALMVLALYFFGQRSFTTLGFSIPILDKFVLGHTLTLIIVYIVDTYKNYIDHKDDLGELKNLEHIMPTSWNDYRHFIFLAFAAGICEEIIFRGFLMNYVKLSMSDSRYINLAALVIPSIAFAAGHFYQGFQAVFKIFAISLLFGAIFMYSGSLYIVMFIHVIIDLLSGAVLVYLHTQKSKE